MTRKLLGGVGTLSLVATLAACPGGGDGPEPPTQAQRGGTVVITELADMDKPMPIISESVLDNQVNAIMYRPVLAPSWEDGRLQYLTHDRNPMALARSYEFFGPDSASLRYRLVSDALWSDGQRITAHDVVWSLETQGDERVGSPRRDYNRNIREVLAEDDSTVVVHFHRRNPEMFFHTAGGVAPRHAYADADLAQLRNHPSITQPVGRLVVSGPFAVGEWVRGQRVVLAPNPNFQPQPNLERVVFRIVPEQTTRMIELQTGNVDVMRGFPFDQIESVRRRGGIRFERQEGRNYDFIGYNPAAHPFFADRDIRRALGLAIDNEGLISALQMDGFARPAGGPYSPIFQELFDPREQAPLPHDPEQARQILASK
jgi:peptide/nickel transport system substrate-binding protein